MSYIKDIPRATADVHVDRFIPHWNGDGQKVYKCIAMAATTSKSTAKTFGDICITDSGPGFVPTTSHNASGMVNFGVALRSAASGQLVDVCVEGYVTGVRSIASGDTQPSSWTKGAVVRMGATGNLLTIIAAATWTGMCHAFGSSGESTGGAVIGVALTSGTSSVVDLLLIGKKCVIGETSA